MFFNTCRDLVSLNPEDFSSSYRRLVLHDFSNAIDDYSIRNCTEKDRSEYALFLDFVSHVNLIRDAVDDDEKDVLLFNFVVVGGVLNQFIVDLSREMVSMFVCFSESASPGSVLMPTSPAHNSPSTHISN